MNKSSTTLSGSLSPSTVERERFLPAACIWPREQEELWAAKHSFLTKFTGWLFILLPLAILVGKFFGIQNDFDLLGIVAGISILKGRQSWIRFSLFVYACGALYDLSGVFQIVVLDQAFQMNSQASGEWITRTDTKFWMEFLPFVGVGVLLPLSAFVCLRSRQLTFWTTTSKVWGGIATGVIAVSLIIGLVSGLNQRRHLMERTQEFAEEIQVVRDGLDSSSSLSSAVRHESVLLSNNRVEKIVWVELNGGASVIFYRGNSYSLSSGEDGEFQLPHTLPSGQRGIIQFHLEETGQAAEE